MNILKCNKCQQEKLTNEFYPRKNSRRGFSSHCKTCRNLAANTKASIKRGDRRRWTIYSVNQDCFNEDSLECWYMAGLIAADGCVIQSEKGKSKRLSNQLSLTLKSEDLPTIQRFKDFCQYSGPISWYKGKYPCCRINSVPNILNTLNTKFKITPRKSLTLSPPDSFPSLDHALAYIVGYIDGDGCIYTKNNLHQIQMLGTVDILNFVIKTFQQLLDFPIVVKPRLASCKTAHQINFSGNLISGKYSPIIYKILSLPIPRMKRKWDKLECLIKPFFFANNP